MRYLFANCEIDDAARVLRRRRAGAARAPVFTYGPCAEPGRRFAGRIEAVWGGRVVSRSAISARIHAPRRAVRDDGERQAYVRYLDVASSWWRSSSNRRREISDPIERAMRLSAPTTDPAVTPPTERIAFARLVQVSLVRAGHWLTHLDHDWHSPVWRPFLQELGKDFTVARYDQRGNGLSDWSPPRFSLDAFIEDLETVVDRASLTGSPLRCLAEARSRLPTPRAIPTASANVLHGGYVQGG